jgi:hypothetical protein
VHDLVLRSQAQAIYSPDNLGHFGLGLSHYAHFTSPIRRYADLQVHRALIAAFGLGDGGQDILPINALKLVGEHISQTERTAAQMEREVMDRYLVLHLEDYVGHTFSATIVGVTGAGIFFALDGSGAQGFLHKSRMPGDYFVHDEENHRYYGSRTKRVFQLGDPLTVILDAADARTSATMFSLPESTNDRPKREWSTKKPTTDKRSAAKPGTRKPGTHKSDARPSEFKKRDSSDKPGLKKRDSAERSFKEPELKDNATSVHGTKKSKPKAWSDKTKPENRKPEKDKAETRKSNVDQTQPETKTGKKAPKKAIKRTNAKPTSAWKSNVKKPHEK